MNPYHLRTFLAAAKHLNYTRAAGELYLSQPAVSRQIRQLETELGVRLFEQIGKSLRLTAAGRTLAGEAEKVLGALERAGEAVRVHRSAHRGSLRIGASTTPGLYLLPDILGRFHRRFPAVDLEYVVESSLDIEEKLVRNELDLGFVGAHLRGDGLRLVPLLEDEIVCFASRSHPLARKRRLAPAALAGEVCVTREKGSATRRLFEEWLASQGVAPGKWIELEGPEAAKALVRGGIGFSFGSVHALGDDLREHRLEKLPVAGLSLRRPIFLARHAEKRDSPVMAAFLEIVRARFPRLGSSSL